MAPWWSLGLRRIEGDKGMSKKFDTRKIETALHKAGRNATTGSLTARSGRIHGPAQSKTIAASALTQKDGRKAK